MKSCEELPIKYSKYETLKVLKNKPIIFFPTNDDSFMQLSHATFECISLWTSCCPFP
jgi:hypothetical protein